MIKAVTTDAVARGARGGGVIAATQFVKLLIQMAGVVVLSRLLSPFDFGLVGMVAVVLSLGDLFRDFGMSTAALQAKTLTPQQASNVFWVSTGLGLASAVAITACTPLLVAFYSEPLLSTLAPVMAIGLLLGGMQTQLQVNLARRLRFTALALTDLLALVGSLGGAIVVALLGWGYWALVIQSLGGGVILLGSRLALTRWVPGLPRRRSGSRSLLQSGTHFGMAQILAFAASNVDTIVVGARLGAVPLGFYNRAFQMYLLPRSGLLDPLTNVVVPTVNGFVREGGSVSGALLRLQFALSAVLVWVYLLLAATAEWLVPAVLGDQWKPAVVLTQILAVGGWFAAFGTISYWTFVLEGGSRELLRLHLVTKPLAVVFVLIAAPFGLEAVATAFALGLAIAWPINLIWLSRTVGQRSVDFLLAGLRVLSAGTISLVGAHFVTLLFQGVPPWGVIAAGSLSATALFFASLLAFPQSRRDLRATLALARAIAAHRRDR